MMPRSRFFLPAVFFLLFVVFSDAADLEKPLLGDVWDGSRAVPVHRIPLLDEEGMAVLLGDELAVPFSIRQTCSANCHSYETVATGWHFNAHDPKADAGRPGHPWIYWNQNTGTVIPLSTRQWPGTFHPEDIGITPWKFAQRFGRHLPGGGAGEAESEIPEETMRGYVSGKLEINCLACHNADPAHDQAEYATQIARQNFRWAAASTSGFAFVSGSAKKMPDTYDYLMPDALNDPKLKPPAITYDEHRFDPLNKVFFDIARNVPNERCYFCHSTTIVGDSISDGRHSSQDVHLAAGLNCVDCHRHGLDHQMTRGDAGDDSHSPFTCEGCHIGDRDDSIPTAGRYGAPQPNHNGIPPLHFDRLTCTACHSGPWPTQQTRLVKTSLAHGLGIRNVNKSPDALPHIQSPVFVRQPDGKIAPHQLMWPSFWGILSGSGVTPISIDVVNQQAARIENKSENPRDSITRILAVLSSQQRIEGKPVYVSDGKLFSLDVNETLSSSPHESAKPYTWPIAHDVRPAAQSLGVRGCQDCHSSGAPFFFGYVKTDSIFTIEPETLHAMTAFQDINPFYVDLLTLSFLFRLKFKIVLLLSLGLLTAVILFGKPTLRFETPVFLMLTTIITWMTPLTFFVLAITGLGPLLTGQSPSGYLLLLHAAIAPLFAVCLAVLAMLKASRYRLTQSDWSRFKNAFSEQNPAGEIPVDETGIGRKIIFWMTIALVIPLILPILFCTFPVFGTPVQQWLIDLHRIIAFLFAAVTIVYLYLSLLDYAKKKNAP